MPVTPGPLTDRLAQVVADVVAAFGALGEKLDTINTGVSDIKSALTGTDPDGANIYELTSKQLERTQTIAADVIYFKNEQIPLLIEKIEGIYDRTGTAQNGLSLAELLQVVAECICELNSKTPGGGGPGGDPLEILGADFECAEGGAVLFVLTPDSWVNTPGIGWHGCPTSLSAAAIAAGYSLTTVTEYQSEQSVAVMAALGETTINACLATGDNTEFVVETLTRKELRRDNDEPNYYIESGSFFVDNIYKTNCRPYDIWQEVETRRHWYYDALVSSETTMPPNCNIYFYTLEATPPPPEVYCDDPLADPEELEYFDYLGTGETFWPYNGESYMADWSGNAITSSPKVAFEGFTNILLSGPGWYKVSSSKASSAAQLYVNISAYQGEFNPEISISYDSTVFADQTSTFFVIEGYQATVTASVVPSTGEPSNVFDSVLTISICASGDAPD